MLNSFAYRHSPIWAQESLISAKSSLRTVMREGRTFEALAMQIFQSQWWSEQQLREFQSQTLRNILGAAALNVPYYRERYRPLGLDFEDAAFPDVIAELPLIAKGDVRAAARLMISERKRGPLLEGSTSGTTGAPLRLYQDLLAINRENAFVWRQLAWAGLRQGDRRAWMRGDMIVPAMQRRPPYWRMNRAENMLMLSSYHLSESAAADYCEALAGFNPVVIQAYPSSIGFLAGWMSSAGVRYRARSLRGIVTSSETLSDDQRREIEDAFGCKVFDWYGQFERVAAIGTCEHARYHLLSDYSYVEMLPAGDGLFELVGTGFNNMSMPLIRYRCADYVVPAPANERCACGRAFPLIEHIIGRADDSIKLPDGRSIGRLDHIFKGVDGILEAQIRQDVSNAVTLLVVPSPTFDSRIRDTLESNTRERLGEEINFEIRLVDAIPRTKNGKFKGVVCNV
jgi:phenylacetate-CoA ligase